MKSLDLVLTYTSNTPEDSLWVHLEQEGLEDDIATVEDTADLLDDIYNIDACSEEDTATEPSVEDVDESAAKVFDYSICASDYEGNIEVRVRVVRSNNTLPYKIYVSDGEILSTEVTTEEIKSEIVVTSTTSITLDYPVIYGGSFFWLSDLVSKGSTEIKRNGSVLYWDAEASGTISCSYTTTYDVITIKVFGVDGEYGKATVRVVYQGEIDDIETEVPDAYDDDRSHCGFSSEVVDNQKVTCYRTVVKTKKCSCSKEEIDTETYDEIVTCPDYAPKKCPGAITECMHFLGTVGITEYVDCKADYNLPGTSTVADKVSDPDYYEKVCCYPAALDLPDCEVEILSYKGGYKIQPSEEYYRGLYGGLTRFKPVTATPNCGQHKIKQELGPTNCCDDVEPLIWDASVSPEVIAPNSAVVIGVTGGGKYPYRWEVVGHGFQFQNGSRSITTESNQVRLSALVGACGTAAVTVTDGCTSCIGLVRSTAGVWAGTCKVLKVDVSPGALAGSRYRTTQVKGCSLVTRDEDFHWGATPSGVNLTVLSITYEWVNGGWRQSTTAPGISGVDIMWDESFYEALGVVRGKVAVVVNGPLPPSPSLLTSCTDDVDPCRWMCA